MNASLHKIILCLTLTAVPILSRAQSTPSPDSSPVTNDKNASPTTQSIGNTGAKPTKLPTIVVTAQAPASAPTTRQQTDLSVGTSTYTMTQAQITQIAQGANTGFNQVLVHTPGVSDDTYGATHFRNEDPYYRYYLNRTLLPSGINGFSQDIDTHFVESVTTKVGALPAYYPEGNYGIVDVTSKSGASLNGGDVSFYGGSFDTLHPEFSYGGSSGGTDFYFTGELSSQQPRPGKSHFEYHGNP